MNSGDEKSWRNWKLIPIIDPVNKNKHSARKTVKCPVQSLATQQRNMKYKNGTVKRNSEIKN